MYHCHIHFQFMGIRKDVFEIIEKMTPLPCFTHEFTESETAETALRSGKADVIMADLRDVEDVKETVHMLASGKAEDTELLLVAGEGQIPLFTEEMLAVKDIWLLPMSEV